MAWPPNAFRNRQPETAGKSSSSSRHNPLRASVAMDGLRSHWLEQERRRGGQQGCTSESLSPARHGGYGLGKPETEKRRGLRRRAAAAAAAVEGRRACRPTRLTCGPHSAMAHLSVKPTMGSTRRSITDVRHRYKVDSTPVWAVGRVRLEAQALGLNSVWTRNATAVFGPNADDR